ncbi:dienelactone hydrolase family protein [Xylariaceae sp. FL1272]|nr:dienelactone hydrolase family protein [Xylariaceae sp. FL1272]
MSCPDCFKGAIHEGEPTGTVTKLHGLDVYIAEPASGNTPKAILVIIPDIFGWDFVNIRLMADAFARRKDYRVYAPDFMDGHAAPPSLLDTMGRVMNPGKTWMQTLAKPYHLIGLMRFAIPAIYNTRPGKTFPIVKSFMEALRQNEAARLPVGVTGYCWGGKHVVLLAEGYSIGDKPLIDVGFTAHPSQLSIPGDIERMNVPVAFASGDKDMNMSVEQFKKIEEIVQAKPGGQKGECKLYPGYGHGFACRADVTNDNPKGQVEVEDQTIEWLEKHFDKVSY